MLSQSPGLEACDPKLVCPSPDVGERGVEASERSSPRFHDVPSPPQVMARFRPPLEPRRAEPRVGSSLEDELIASSLSPRLQGLDAVEGHGISSIRAAAVADSDSMSV